MPGSATKSVDSILVHWGGNWKYLGPLGNNHRDKLLDVRIADKSLAS